MYLYDQRDRRSVSNPWARLTATIRLLFTASCTREVGGACFGALQPPVGATTPGRGETTRVLRVETVREI